MMTSAENNGQQVRVNYQAPIWATIIASLLLMLVTGFLGFIGLGSLFTFIGFDRDYITATFCGIFELGMFIGVAFFGLAIIKGVRDLGTPMQYASGVVVNSSARQQIGGGAFWLVIDTDLTAEDVAPRKPTRYIPLSESKAMQEEVDNTRRVFGAAPATPSDTAQVQSSSSGPEDIFARNERLVRASVVRFRVDKPVYQLLHLNDRVTIAYSRYLEHVYYVQHWQGDNGVVLYNRSLL